MEYREKIAEEYFGVPNNELSVDVLALGAKGSVFDGIEYDGRASEMDVRRRWLHFIDNDVFWCIFDLESMELNLQIRLKGTL